MFSLKLKYQNEVRRVQIPEQTLSFQEMLKTARAIFTSMIGNEDVSFLWVDDENDVIRCSNDEEIREAVRVMASGKVTLLKFEVQVGREAKVLAPSSDEVHEGVQCDRCGVFPLIGVRFKCAVRDDFDLCEACEAKDDPKFPMLKINIAKQAPLQLVVVLKNENGQPNRDFQGTGDHRSRPCWGNPWRPQHGPGHHSGPFDSQDHNHFGHSQNPPNRPRGSGCDWRPQAESILKGLGEDLDALGASSFGLGRGCLPQREDPPNAESASESVTAGVSGGAAGEGRGDAGTTALPPLLAMADAFISTLKGNQLSNPDSTSCGQWQSCGQAPITLSPFLAMADTLLSTLKKDESSGAGGGSEKCGDEYVKGGATTDLDKVKASGARGGSTWMPRQRHGRGGCPGSGGGGPCAPHDLTPPREEAAAEEARLVQLAVKESTSRSEREIEEDRLIEEALRESMADESPARPTSAAAPSTPAINAVEEKVDNEALHPASHAMEPMRPNGSVAASSDPTAVWARVWAKELQVLADMGFVDVVALLPLLQEHVGVPVSLCPQLNGAPPAEGMQRLLGALLAQSGMLH